MRDTAGKEPPSDKSLRRDVEAFARSIRDRGVPRTLRIASGTLWWTLLDRMDELRFRTATTGDVPIASLDTVGDNKEHAGPYASPSQFRITRRALRAIQDLRGYGFADSTLVDFGCGKGRVLLVGSEFGFKKMIGVEFSPELCSDARWIIEAFAARRHRAFAFEIVNSDAARFDVPADADVFYFFNPFDDAVMVQSVENILRSHDEAPRPMWAAYVKATHGKVFLEHGFRVARALTFCGFPTLIYVLGA